MKSFGLNFILVNDVRQQLSRHYPEAQHLGTFVRGLDEYIVFSIDKNLYIEKLERNRATLAFKRIDDESEFADALAFATAAGLTSMQHRGEIKIGFWEDDQTSKSLA
jgi:hypothetical protein